MRIGRILIGVGVTQHLSSKTRLRSQEHPADPLKEWLGQCDIVFWFLPSGRHDMVQKLAEYFGIKKTTELRRCNHKIDFDPEHDVLVEVLPQQDGSFQFEEYTAA